MTILEAINEFDALVRNTDSLSDKTRWLSEVDAAVKKEIIDTHEGGEAVRFAGYDDATDPDTRLLVDAPYDGLYLKYLEAQFDYYNGEFARYNNAMAAYNTLWSAFERWYNRTHMPLSRKRDFWGEGGR